MHIGAKLAQLALAYPDRTAIVDEAGSWSFRRFHQRLTRFGNAMHGLGLTRGDRIALLLPDCREYLEADYGTMAAGLVRVPMDPRLTRRELVALLQHAGARALMVARARKLVVAALIRDGGRVLMSRRRADQPMPLLWEFPGGKIEPGETPEQALEREVREELGVGATVLAQYFGTL